MLASLSNLFSNVLNTSPSRAEQSVKISTRAAAIKSQQQIFLNIIHINLSWKLTSCSKNRAFNCPFDQKSMA